MLWLVTYDRQANLLFGSDTFNPRLVVIDRSTGRATALGTPFLDSVRGLASDDTGTLYGVDFSEDVLLTFDDVTQGRQAIVGVVGHEYMAGLAYDPGTGVLFATTGAEIIRVDISTGLGTTIGVASPGHLTGLAFDPVTETLYACDRYSSFLFRIDTITGEASIAATLELTGLAGLAFDPNTATLFSVTSNGEQLIAIDPTTGSGTVVGNLDFGELDGLTYDPGSGLLYASARDLIAIDPVTAQGIIVDELLLDEVNGLAFDANGKTLYGVKNWPATLLKIDTDTALITSVGSLPSAYVTSLTFDPNRLVLYADEAEYDHLVEIDPRSGTASGLSRFKFGSPHAMAFDPFRRILYGVQWNYLFAIDPPTGSVTLFGPIELPSFTDIATMVFDVRTDTLYGADDHTGAIFTIDPIALRADLVADLPVALDSITAEPVTHTFYGLDGTTMFALDPATWSSKLVGEPGLPYLQGLAAVSTDCNNNGIPDECDILIGTSPDADGNFIPDECQCGPGGNEDCDDGIACTIDVCDDPVGLCRFQPDDTVCDDGLFCNGMERCDVTVACQPEPPPCGIGEICIEKEARCEFDCNANGIRDACDISCDALDAKCDSKACGMSEDCNANGVPDDCEDYGRVLGANKAFLLELDGMTGAASAISGLGFSEFRDIQALAMDANSNMLYGIHGSTDLLIMIDLGTGNTSIVGPVGFDDLDGLAFDSTTMPPTLYAAGWSGSLVTIDPSTAETELVGDIGLFSIRGMAFDPLTQTLYAVDVPGDLLVIDVLTTEVTVVGPLGFNWPECLAFDSQRQTLFVSDASDLYTVNTETGQATEVATLVSWIQGLTYDPNLDVMYGADALSGHLIRIDPSSYETESVQILGFGFVRGLAFDPGTNSFFATDSPTDDDLFRIDAETGAPTYVGPIGFDAVTGLAYDENTDTLYGVDSTERLLLEIDTVTGQGAVVGPLMLTSVWNLGSLTFDSDSDQLYGTYETGSGYDALMTIDTATGEATYVGTIGNYDVHGLVFDSDSDVLVGGAFWPSSLLTIDPSTAEPMLLMPLVASAYALAINTSTGALYGATSRLMIIDPETGNVEMIGALGFWVEGLAFDPWSRILHAVTKDLLISIDLATGSGTSRSELEFSALDALAFDTNARKLFAINYGDWLIEIDPLTAETVVIAKMEETDITGLAFDPFRDLLFAIDFWGEDQLITIDPSSGEVASVALLADGVGVTGLTFDRVNQVLIGADLIRQVAVVIDPSTGETTDIGPTGYLNIDGLTFVPDDFNCNGVPDECEPVVLLGDFDGDGDVDLMDYSAFQQCVTMPGGEITPGCEPADFDFDGDADLLDWAMLQVWFTG